MSPDDLAVKWSETFKGTNGDRDLASLVPFANMNDAQRQGVLEQANLRHIIPDTNCFEAGAAADNFFLLLEGVVRIVRTTADGEQVIVLHVLPGQMFGIARAFENDTYFTTATAVSNAVLLSWPSHLWDQFSRDYPGFLSASRQAVGTRVDGMQNKIVAMATLKVEQRIAHAVLDLVKRAGLQTTEGIEIGFPITRQDISEMTGTTLHSVSRYMSKWQKTGIIVSRRKRVIVRRPDELPV